MNRVLSLLNYEEHQWLISGYLKYVGPILDLQSGYTKYPCVMCLWDKRAETQHYIKQEWPTRQGLKPGPHNSYCSEQCIACTPTHLITDS